MISFEKHAEIVRLYKAEAFRRPGTIARVAGVHPDAVRRVLASEGLLAADAQLSAAPPAPRESQLDPFAAFIDATLARYPDICASRIFGMIRERGYQGVSQGHVRRFVAKRRPKQAHEAFLRLSFLPGEQAQVDWAHFGPAGEAYPGRKLYAFVMTLSYSRHIFFRFFLSMRMREFLQGFVEGFKFFGGVPRTILIDNLKSGVTERVGDVIRFNSHFLELASHYAFEPRAAGVRRGNDKGRVERSIRYVRDSFFAARKVSLLSELNAQAASWCTDMASQRPWHDDRALKVLDAFAVDSARLLALPARPYPCVERSFAKVGKQPYVWFDGNEYSVPHRLVGTQVELVASESELCIHGEGDALPAASHVRTYGRHEVVEDAAHIDALRRAKPRAARASGLARLVNVVPEAKGFVEQLALRGENVGGAIGSLLRALQTHGVDLVRAALVEVTASGSCTLRAVHFTIRRMELASGLRPEAEPAVLPERFATLNVTHHDTKTYDAITGVTKE